ncbi:MAG TPA: decaprenyl-phosphate phosphoribosyltransferase [Deltaproteobacteria bacterium]|nr:decaprenyl-phosphate phosphoribosyltransferase [Deltaproteobacteria bacterium]
MITKLKHVIVSMRPVQWVKNLFIFAGLIFSGNLFHPEALIRVGNGFILFSLVASSIYVFNDIIDLEYDRAHPEKKNRPLAAGLMSVPAAYACSILLAAAGLICALALDQVFFAILLSYLIINVAYTIKIKKIVILDIMCIASGFVLRVLAGTELAEVMASDWLILCTIMLSLFLGFSKRRHELVVTGTDALSHRKVLGDYSISFLDQMIAVATACTVMSYALYTVSPQTVSRFGTRNLVFSIPFVIYGIYRYLYLIHQKNMGGNPTRELVSDLPMLINALLWALLVVLIIYRD